MFVTISLPVVSFWNGALNPLKSTIWMKCPHMHVHNTFVRLQNLPWYKTGLVSRQVLHLLSKLQNWICPKTGQYKPCIVSNTKIEASIRATKPKPCTSSQSVVLVFGCAIICCWLSLLCLQLHTIHGCCCPWNSCENTGTDSLPCSSLALGFHSQIVYSIRVFQALWFVVFLVFGAVVKPLAPVCQYNCRLIL